MSILGRFVWHELVTTHPDAARDFYPAVLGWGSTPFGGPGGAAEYSLWTREGVGVGGLSALPEAERDAGAHAHWMPYVAAPDVDATVATATRLGARAVVGPATIPGVGRWALIEDPQGATIALLSPEGPEGEEGEPRVGEFSWDELATADHRAAFDFYRAVFGWEQTGTFDMGGMGEYRLYGRAGRTLGGMYTKPASVPAPPHWLGYVRVEDVGRGVEAVRAGGGQVLHGPAEVPGGDRIAMCLDPQGAAFALHQRK